MSWLMKACIEGMISGGIVWLTARLVGAYDILAMWQILCIMVASWAGLDLSRYISAGIDKGK